MKLHADLAVGVNVVNAYTANSVSVNGVLFRSSILVPATGEVITWPVATLEDLTEAHFAQIAQTKPELIVFGTGPKLRFAPPSMLQSLLTTQRIGIETMDTPAACRTFNILVAEGRQALAALLIAP